MGEQRLPDQAGELPVGLMVWHAALRDDAVLNIGLLIEQELQNNSYWRLPHKRYRHF